MTKQKDFVALFDWEKEAALESAGDCLVKACASSWMWRDVRGFLLQRVSMRRYSLRCDYLYKAHVCQCRKVCHWMTRQVWEMYDAANLVVDVGLPERNLVVMPSAFGCILFLCCADEEFLSLGF